MKLSVSVRKIVGMTPNPWTRLYRDWPDLPVRYGDLGTRWGRTSWANGRPVEIVLHRKLHQVERRVTIAHELEHLDRGAPCSSLSAAIEHRVLQATARYLLPDLEHLARAVAVYDLHQAADHLCVTFPVIVDRLNGLTEEESLYVHSYRDEAVA